MQMAVILISYMLIGNFKYILLIKGLLGGKL